MKVELLIKELEDKGLHLELNGDHVRIRSSEPIPPAVKERLRPIKNEILAFLRGRQTDPGPSPEGFGPQGGKVQAIHIKEASKLFKERGWVQIFSGHLGQCVYLVRDDQVEVPDPAIPRYTRKEIEALKDLTLDELKTLHEAKVIFGGGWRERSGTIGN